MILKTTIGSVSNLCKALRVLLTCPISVAGAERSFSKLKPIKTFHRFPVVDERFTSPAMIFIKNACVRSLGFKHIVNLFTAEKSCCKTFSKRAGIISQVFEKVFSFCFIILYHSTALVKAKI